MSVTRTENGYRIVTTVCRICDRACTSGGMTSHRRKHEREALRLANLSTRVSQLRVIR